MRVRKLKGKGKKGKKKYQKKLTSNWEGFDWSKNLPLENYYHYIKAENAVFLFLILLVN